METLIPGISAGCSQTQWQESPFRPTREWMHNSRKPFTRGNQLVVQELSCMMILYCTSSCNGHPCYRLCSCWGVSSKMFFCISVRVQSQDCVPTNTVQERAPERDTNSATNFWKCTKHYAHACSRFAGMFADPFADKCRAHCLRVVCVKGICGRNLWLSTGHASQSKPTQRKYW